MPASCLCNLDLKVMDTLWTRGASSMRDIRESFPARGRPAYTTLRATIYRLKAKKVVRRVRRIRNAHLFEAIVSREAVQRRLAEVLVGLFGRRSRQVIAHLIESGKLTQDEMREAERLLTILGKRDSGGGVKVRRTG